VGIIQLEIIIAI